MNRQNGWFKRIAFLLALTVPLTACVSRTMVVCESQTANQNESISETRQPSTVFEKQYNSDEIMSETPGSINPGNFNWYGVPDMEDPLHADVNKFLSENYGVRPVKLKGFDHFLNWLWGMTNIAVGVGAIIVGLFASNIAR
jgi:hypothetical protein